MKAILLLLLLVVCVAAAKPVAASQAVSVSSARAALVKSAFNKQLHQRIVVDARGRTLYMFLDDSKNSATCLSTRPCGKAWPPLVPIGRPRGGEGIIAARLGITRRSDGQVQVTYNGHPLYHFAGYAGTAPDKKPGEINGQGLYQLWYVISPNGNQITVNDARRAR